MQDTDTHLAKRLQRTFLSRYTFPAEAEIFLANPLSLSSNIGVNLCHDKYTSATGNCCS